MPTPQNALAPRIDGEMRATPRNALLGLLADALSSVDQYANKPDRTMPMGKANPVLGLLSNALGVGDLAATANNLSYGHPLTQGTGWARQMYPETANALLAAAPVAAKFPKQAAAVTAGLLSGDANAARAAITPMTRPILEGMSRDEFLGSPRIVGMSDASSLRPKALNSMAEAEAVPFMGGKFTAKFSPDGAVVFDGQKPIASYNFGDTLTVDPKYRKQGIGEELVYQQRTFFPEPAKASTRNKVSQKIQENVWSRIQNDLQNMD